MGKYTCKLNKGFLQNMFFYFFKHVWIYVAIFLFPLADIGLSSLLISGRRIYKFTFLWNWRFRTGKHSFPFNSQTITLKLWKVRKYFNSLSVFSMCGKCWRMLQMCDRANGPDLLEREKWRSCNLATKS